MHRGSGISFGVRPLPGRPALLGAVVLTGVVVAGVFARGVPAARVAYILVERLIGAGLAEELFLRGYAQSRVDGAFGRKWTAFGTRIGPGLFVAPALFGGIHLFNPTLWYLERFDLDWPWGLTSFLSGLVYGWLRERSRGIWLPAFVHGWLDVLEQLWLV